MDLTVHCVVKNEDKWLWFALQSVLPYAKRVLVFDTGSSDKTVEIAQSIKSPKVYFREKGEVSKKKLVELRQEQIDLTETAWFLILDGDEIWDSRQIEHLIEMGEKSSKETVAVFNSVRNCIGDIYHYLPESSGKYRIKGMSGNLNIRLIKKTRGMRVSGEYPLEVYQDKNGPIQYQDDNLIYGGCWCLHTTFLNRSSEDKNKVSGSFGKGKVWQRGIVLDQKELPEVFTEKRPEMVSDPLKKRGLIYELVSTFFSTPLLEIKSKLR